MRKKYIISLILYLNFTCCFFNANAAYVRPVYSGMGSYVRWEDNPDLCVISIGCHSFNSEVLSPAVGRDYPGFERIKILEEKPSSCGKIINLDEIKAGEQKDIEWSGGSGSPVWRFEGIANPEIKGDFAQVTAIEQGCVKSTLAGTFIFGSVTYTLTYFPNDQYWQIEYDVIEPYYVPGTGMSTPWEIVNYKQPTIRSIIFTDGPEPLVPKD